MSKITIYCEACLKVDGFQSMGEEFIRKLVINGKAKFTHRFAKRQRAPPSVVADGIPNYCHIR